MENPNAWFEIPVQNMDRAIQFYNNVFGYKLKSHDFGAVEMAQLPYDKNLPGSSGALIFNMEYYIPSSKGGVLIYFECQSVKDTLIKVIEQEGKVLIHEKEISPDHGSMGVFLDSEGNRIALRSNSVE